MLPERPESPEVKASLKLEVKDSQPFYFQPHRLSYVEKERLRLILDELERTGIIRPSKSEYVSPIVLVRKKNNEIRMCVDFRVL